jgi:hypothetical protein
MYQRPNTQVPQVASVAEKDVLDEAPDNRGADVGQGVRSTMNASGLAACPAKAEGFLNLILGANCE